MSRDKREERIPLSDSPDKTEQSKHTRPDTVFTMDQHQLQQHAKVERFLKLGYSHTDILRVLESLHHDAQTNDILEELIKTCQTHSYNNDDSSQQKNNSPKLVPRGCSPGPSHTGDREPAAGFRPVVIDGSNVAMSHGDKKVFSCQGLQLAVNWFWDKGLRDITVFVPLWRKEQSRPDAPITDQHVLHELERRKILVYTPSRCVNGKRVVCYDDRYIVKLAFDSDGIIVSNDNYRDLQTENPQWKKFIEERLLMYTFANDKFMPPYDPLGRNGPTIDDFLRKKLRSTDNKLQHCPYGKKCTYGVKCKFYHPERTNQSQLSVADELRALRDRAKNFSPRPSMQDTTFCPAVYQLEHRYSCSTPPPVSTEETQSHRASPSELFIHHRDSSSPRSLHHCPSTDVDEAFGSMESSMSRLHIRDMSFSTELHPHSYSSGVGSCSLSHQDYSLPGSYGGSMQRPCLSAGYRPHHDCSQCSCGQQQSLQQSLQQQPAWSSCPALLQHKHVSETQHFNRHSHAHTVPTEPWLQGLNGREQKPSTSCEQRKDLRSQLSTLFPQSTVERVMNAYPDISDMSALIPLIQSYRTSHISL
ncbi:probable ribonuclease ZC3H12D [Solea solea]|uniref:probable ribonuclease ZC3H12D n=1 Tax=Solea solea TaxID=90069 RepID=UPI00272BE988|nr:probable ribonuclease ZC3H12D [Solea solea]